MKTTLYTLLFLLALPVFAGPGIKYNAAGYKLYKQGRFREALPWFRKAAKTDPGYLYARYNLACTLALLLEKHYCDYLGSVGEMWKNLEAAFRINPGQCRHAATDPDLRHCRKYLRYYKLMGYSWKRQDHLRTMLIKTVWALPGQGAINPIAEAKFLPDGSFRLGWGWEKQRNGKYGRNRLHGRYTIGLTNGAVYLHLKYRNGRRERVLWKPWDGFHIPSIDRALPEYPGGTKIRNFLGDCSA